MHKLFKINNFDSEYSSKTIQGQIFALKNHVYDSRDLKSVMLKEIRVFNEKMWTTKKKIVQCKFLRASKKCQRSKSLSTWQHKVNGSLKKNILHPVETRKFLEKNSFSQTRWKLRFYDRQKDSFASKTWVIWENSFGFKRKYLR